MIDVELLPVPNQSLSITLDGAYYELAIKEATGCMVMSVARDGAPIIASVRLVAGSPVLPAQYQEAGNFVLLGNEAEELPYYDQFGVTQFLVYLSPAEVSALRA